MHFFKRIFSRIAKGLDAVFPGSVDSIPYIIRMEDEFGIQIADHDALNITTLAELCNYIEIQMHVQCKVIARDEIWTRVCRITSEEFGIDSEELHPGIRFVEDLGC